MNILFDIGHPGHVHLLKHTIKDLKSKGHFILITVKDIPIAKQLLMAEGLEFIDLGSKKNSIFGKSFNQIKYNIQILKLVWKHNIELGVGTSISIPHVSKLSKMKSIVLDDDDDEVEPLFVKFAHPFCDTILTPDSIKRKSKKSIYYAGTHELAYLHPNNFKPNPEILKEIGVTEHDLFFILRFVAFQGHHDIGEKGICFKEKLKIVDFLKEKGKVFITSEKPIEPELEKYRVPIAAHKMHSLLYYATMFIGDSQTMTSEACILGTPAIKCNSFSGRLSVPNELEKKYELCFSYTPADIEAMYLKINELLNIKNIKTIWKEKTNNLMSDKIDVSAFLIWFIENYPNSKDTMNQKSDFQYKFR